MATLPEDPWRYFKRTSEALLLPVSKLRAVSACPRGVVNASNVMALVYEGKESKFDPVHVRQEQDGTYTVLEGSSRYASAVANNWCSVPTVIVGSGSGSKTAYRPRWQNTPGYQTFVDQKSQLGILPGQQESKTDTGTDNADAAWPVQPGEAREKERALPLPSNHSKKRDKKVGPTTFNKPTKIPYRTLSVPGEQYGHPTKYDYNSPTRRPGVTAANPLPTKRQNKLPPAYAKKMRMNYRQNPSKKLKSRIKYKTRGKFDPAAKRYRKYYRQYPQRYKRRGMSPHQTPAERTKAWREDQKQQAKRKGITPKQQERNRKRSPKSLRTRTPGSSGSTSRTYSLTRSLVDAWDKLGANWAVEWETQLKKTQPPEQLDQNYGKGQSRDTGVPRKDPKKQDQHSLRTPNLDTKHQPGLMTQHHPPAAGVPNVQVNNPTSGSGKVLPLSYYTDFANNTQQIPSGRQDRYLHNNNFQVKQAATMEDILRRVDNLVELRAKARVPKLTRTDTKNWIWHWKSGDWKVKVQAFKRGNATNLRKLNLRISCNCPFWRWQGPEHWAKQGGYLLGQPQGSASRPEVRDPKHVHPVCKHVYAVLEKSKKFFVRPKKSPLRKMGAHGLVDHAEDVGVEIVVEPSPARVARMYLEHRQISERVAARYLERESF